MGENGGWEQEQTFFTILRPALQDGSGTILVQSLPYAQTFSTRYLS